MAAEAVGLAASIIAILELTKKTTEYLRDVKGGADDRARLLSEILSLKGLLGLLNDEFQKQDPLTSTTKTLSDSIKWLLEAEGPLPRIEKVMIQLSAKLEPGEGWKKRARIIKWPFQKEEIFEHLDTIERCKASISLALNHDHK